MNTSTRNKVEASSGVSGPKGMKRLTVFLLLTFLHLLTPQGAKGLSATTTPTSSDAAADKPGFPMYCTFPDLGESYLSVKNRFRNELSERQIFVVPLKPGYTYLHIIEQVAGIHAFFYKDRLELLLVIPYGDNGGMSMTPNDIAARMMSALKSRYKFTKVSDNTWMDKSAGVGIIIHAKEVELKTTFSANTPPL